MLSCGDCHCYFWLKHNEMFNFRTVIYFRMNFISVLLPVSDVYISTSNDPDPRTQCGYEVNIMLSDLCSTDITVFWNVM